MAQGSSEIKYLTPPIAVDTKRKKILPFQEKPHQIYRL